MAYTITVTEYDKNDIEKLDDMTVNEVIDVLEQIKYSQLPQDYVCGTHDGETYTKDQYDITRMHKAMRKAIEMLEESEVKR